MKITGNVVQLVPMGVEEAQARIRELEAENRGLKELIAKEMQHNDLMGRITRAKAILEGWNEGIPECECDQPIQAALAALEGK